MRIRFLFLMMLACAFIACHNNQPTVTTVAGKATMGSEDGSGTGASFANLMGIAADSAGNVFIADSHNNLVRKMTPAGIVSTIAGSSQNGLADGNSKQASFFNPAALAVDAAGNIYVADTHNSLIRKIAADGTVTTIAGKRTPGKTNETDTAVWFDNPQGIAVDVAGNLYVTDWAKDVVRKIDPHSGKVSVLAGSGKPGASDGIGVNASFYLPEGIAIDKAGNLYVADTYNNMIRKIKPDGTVTTLAGKKTKGSHDGKDTAASFSHPAGLAIDKNGNIYVADVGNNKIRKITPAGLVSTYAGTGKRGSENGLATEATFYRPYGVAVDNAGNVYVADYQNNMVRKIAN